METKKRFILLDEVLAFHDNLIQRYGGSSGIRDMGLLLAAIAQPQMSFGGRYLHEDVYAMAAAYLYHLIKNHAFVDGNKRTAIVTMIVFLKYHDIPISMGQDELYDLAIGVATSQISKEELAKSLKKSDKVKFFKE